MVWLSIVVSTVETSMGASMRTVGAVVEAPEVAVTVAVVVVVDVAVETVTAGAVVVPVVVPVMTVSLEIGATRSAWVALGHVVVSAVVGVPTILSVVRITVVAVVVAKGVDPPYRRSQNLHSEGIDHAAGGGVGGSAGWRQSPQVNGTVVWFVPNRGCWYPLSDTVCCNC